MSADVVHVDGTPSYWRVDLVGEVTAEDFRHLAADYRAQVGTWSRVLIDASGLVNASQALTLLVRERGAAACIAEVRQAAVVNESSAAAARSWVRLVAPGSGGAQAFVSREAALSWLCQPVQSTTGGS